MKTTDSKVFSVRVIKKSQATKRLHDKTTSVCSGKNIKANCTTIGRGTDLKLKQTLLIHDGTDLCHETVIKMDE